MLLCLASKNWDLLYVNHQGIAQLRNASVSKTNPKCCKVATWWGERLQFWLHRLTFQREPSAPEVLKPLKCGRGARFELADGLPHLRFSREAGHVQPTRNNFLAFVRRTEILGEPPIVVHAPEELLHLGAPPAELSTQPTDDYPADHADADNADQIAQIERLLATEIIAVDLVKYLRDKLVLNVRCPTDGWLLVTDRWARRRRAEVNGKPVAVYGGNFIFRAVQVSKGKNSIRFTYRPFGFPWLVIISWGTLVGVICSSLNVGLNRWRASSSKVAIEV